MTSIFQRQPTPLVSNLRYAFIYAVISMFVSTNAVASPFELAQGLDPSATSPGVSSRQPGVCTDGPGVWIASWSSVQSDALLIARSIDAGATWSAPIEIGFGREPAIATDGMGTWVVAASGVRAFEGFGTDRDIFVSASSDDGLTWSDQVPANANAMIDDTDDVEVAMVTDGGGRWMAVWRTWGDIEHALSAVSTDAGGTWSAALSLDAAAMASDRALSPDVATDSAGTWVAVWEVGTSPDTFPRRVLFARSTDNGASWSPAAILNSDPEEPGGHFRPEIATDAQGTWIAVWIQDVSSNPGGFRGDLVFSRSFDAGQTWTPTAGLHPHFEHDKHADDEHVELVTDKAGTWAAIWYTGSKLDGKMADDFDIAISRSRDDGQRWSSPSAVTSLFAGEDGSDQFAKLALDAQGNWVAVWESDLVIEEGNPTDGNDVVVAVAHRDCPDQPSDTCLQSTESGRSRLTLIDKSRAGKASLKWQWNRGQETPASSFGAPDESTQFTLCLYEREAAQASLVHELDVRPGLTCGGAPCWKTTADGFAYKDKKRERSAVQSIRLRAGESGRARVQMKAKGALLALPRLPLAAAPTVTLQLINSSNGECWTSDFSSPDVNDETRFKASSD